MKVPQIVVDAPGTPSTEGLAAEGRSRSTIVDTAPQSFAERARELAEKRLREEEKLKKVITKRMSTPFSSPFAAAVLNLDQSTISVAHLATDAEAGASLRTTEAGRLLLNVGLRCWVTDHTDHWEESDIGDEYEATIKLGKNTSGKYTIALHPTTTMAQIPIHFTVDEIVDFHTYSEPSAAVDGTGSKHIAFITYERDANQVPVSLKETKAKPCHPVLWERSGKNSLGVLCVRLESVVDRSAVGQHVRARLPRRPVEKPFLVSEVPYHRQLVLKASRLAKQEAWNYSLAESQALIFRSQTRGSF